MRCMHEAQLHDHNSFITLTYDPKHVPENGSLNRKHLQDFWKRLRKKIAPTKIRYYSCGEYGEQLKRPHFHACLFGYDFPDRELFTIKDETRLYVSQTLRMIWPYGYSTVGDVTPESAAYVARYVTKKITGEAAPSHYALVNPETGEITGQLEPEYTTMSNRPGIGSDWYDKYKTDVFPSDFLIFKNKKMPPPRYYSDKFQIENPEEMTKILKERKVRAKAHSENQTPERLAVREQVQHLRSRKLKREIECL